MKEVERVYSNICFIPWKNRTLDIKDPVQVVASYEPTREDVGTMVNGVIGCIPGIGALCSSVFSIFWKNAVDPPETIESKLVKFKKEILDIVDKKIKDGSIQIWKDLCSSSLDGLKNGSRELANRIEIINTLLYENKKISSETKSLVQTQLDICINSVENLIALCANDSYDNYVLQNYVQALLTLTMFRRLQDAFWYQFGYHSYQVCGRYPIEGKTKGVKSFREMFHDKLIAGINDVANCMSENWAEDEGKYNEGLEAVPQLLKNDMYIYPVPLVVLDSFPDTIQVKDNPVIYRIDAWKAPIKEGLASGGVNPRPPYDPITGCYGVDFLHKAGFNLKLSENCRFQIRVFGCYAWYYNARMYCTVTNDKNSKEYTTDLRDFEFPVRSTFRNPHIMASYKKFETGIACSPHFEGKSVKVRTAEGDRTSHCIEKLFFFEIVVSKIVSPTIAAKIFNYYLNIFIITVNKQFHWFADLSVAVG
ncbi:hypothetical protein PPL_11374 [Heterostelium album PN500]|uniref:Pesticidal crystal protein N-terminal domain-containing protein n=1 Tax=Heterostelium pallidum (strain ATCC 26659 / Pp 5 / PN500) TaxID=670386 RepID=D3BT81_HETP5|nr:hypothetical protein PPL_11374 [Heterostelium album PN500]EFA75298.1 hypothetical protein PPL_11374 [Heterostelium album PN500]|eukprot:XP_020427432.1 hypothetical protein PPL_11374 [Heterostelium album PN500]